MKSGKRWIGFVKHPLVFTLSSLFALDSEPSLELAPPSSAMKCMWVQELRNTKPTNRTNLCGDKRKGLHQDHVIELFLLFKQDIWCCCWLESYKTFGNCYYWKTFMQWLLLSSAHVRLNSCQIFLTGVWVSPVILFNSLTILWIVGKVCARSAGVQNVCDKALKHVLIIQCDRPSPLCTNQIMRGSLWVLRQRTPGSDRSLSRLLSRPEISLRGSVWSWRDSLIGSVKRLSGVAGLGPSTFAFLRGKLSGIISAHSNRGPWDHKGLAVSASPHPGLIIFDGGERPRLQRHLIMPTPQRRMHLQTTGVYLLIVWGTFLSARQDTCRPRQKQANSWLNHISLWVIREDVSAECCRNAHSFHPLKFSEDT